MILDARLNAINDTQKRTRVALAICTLASGAILAGLFNLYASSDRLWAASENQDRPESPPTSWVKQQVQLRQIATWVDGHIVGVSLLGIRLSTSDAASVGTFVLVVFGFYHCLCARRENHEIGAILIEMKDDPEEDERKLTFRRISAFMVSDTGDANDAPFTTLDEPRATRHIKFSRSGLALLTYLPVVTIAVIVASDLYFVGFYTAPYDDIETVNWVRMSVPERAWFVAIECAAVSGAIIAWYYARLTIEFRNGTQSIVQMFGQRLSARQNQTVSVT